MRDDLRRQILERLKQDYHFRKDQGEYLREGKCPDCGKRELWINAAKPWALRCGRMNKCGGEWQVKELYDDLFNDWSKNHPSTQNDPHAAARAYLSNARGLNITKLAGCFTQEIYQDWQSKATSATVRFAMPCTYGGEDGKPGYWERIIDRPQRFGKKKANMPKGWSYRGHVWHHPHSKLDDFAATNEIWFAEGIFDAASLGEAFEASGRNAMAASSLSTNNYPFEFLEALKKAAHNMQRPLPKLIFAFDVGPAGVSYTRKYVKRAREEGWTADAAQVRPDGEGSKSDWNDLLIAEKLSEEDVQEYLSNGAITIADSAAEKAFLLWKRSKRPEFHFTFTGRTFWARFSAEQINTKIEAVIESQGSEKAKNIDPEKLMEDAAREVVQVNEIANCIFRTLYFQRDDAIDDSSYYLRVDFPGKQDSVKANFPGNAMLKEGPFTDRLMSVAPGGIFDGSTSQLKSMMRIQNMGIRTVDALYYSGYSIDHSAWMFDDIAVSNGRAVPINEEDYFEIGKIGVKPAHALKEFRINPDAEDLDYSWWDDFQLAFGPRGTVALGYWFLSLFAEQIRGMQQSLGFLEMTGDAGTGKSTLLIFLWKLMGRYDGYEGFDPSTATAAAIARQLVKYGNLPTVMLEGDRSADQLHSRKFDWNELKKLYNGHSPRDRGVANAGVTTFAPRFRGSLVIAQNHPIRDADTPVLERIMALHFDKSGHSTDGKYAARRIESAEPENLSGWIIQMIRQEKDILKLFQDRYAQHEQRYLADPEVQNGRLAHNHAQLAAALDCLFKAMKDGPRPVMAKTELQAGQDMITTMVRERHGAISADHPIIAQFWENFDTLADRFPAENFLNQQGEHIPMNLHRNERMIAVHMPTFEARCADVRLSLPAPMLEIKKMLSQSKSRKFSKKGIVNCIDNKSRHCFVFDNPENQSTGGMSNV